MGNDFKEQYLSLKKENKTDREIAKLMFIAVQTLRNYKKKYDVPFIKAPTRNRLGITEEQFKQAESIGLDRYVVLLRVREYGWTIEKAISTPKKPRNKRREKRSN